MLNDTFYFKGVRASKYGITLREPIRISAPVPIVETQRIPGRTEDLHYYNGTFENRTITVPCYILGYNVDKNISEFNRILLGENGYFEFKSTNDTKHYMMARAKNGIEIRKIAGVMNAFDLIFDADPKRYIIGGNVVLYSDEFSYGQEITIPLQSLSPGITIPSVKFDLLGLPENRTVIVNIQNNTFEVSSSNIENMDFGSLCELKAGLEINNIVFKIYPTLSAEGYEKFAYNISFNKWEL